MAGKSILKNACSTDLVFDDLAGFSFFRALLARSLPFRVSPDRAVSWVAGAGADTAVNVASRAASFCRRTAHSTSRMTGIGWSLLTVIGLKIGKRIATQ
jgi:hypothetical protein